MGLHYTSNGRFSLAGEVTALFVWRNWVFIDVLLLPICFVFGVGFVSYGNHLELKLRVELPSRRDIWELLIYHRGIFQEVLS
jgi:hypothetical protein